MLTNRQNTTVFSSRSIVRIPSNGSLNNMDSPKHGVKLAERIAIGNLAACKKLNQILELDENNTDLKSKVDLLIPLIERNRNALPLSRIEKENKIILQKQISNELKELSVLKMDN